MCWHERVTGSRVRQLQPRLLEQRFSVRRFVYPAISPPILESLRSSLLSFFSFLFFLLSGPTTKFLHTLGAHVSRRIARNSSFCVIFNFCLFENHGMGMKFEVPPSPPPPRNRERRVARSEIPKRETSNCVLYFTSAANYGKNNRSRARVSRRIRRSIRSTASFPFPLPRLN